MADKKITALTAATTTVASDLLYLARDPFGVTDDRKCSLTTFFTNVPLALAFSTGVAATNGNYQIFRDNSGTNQMVLNVPTGSGINFGVNGTWEFSLSATSADFKANTLDAVGNISASNNITTWDLNLPVNGTDITSHTMSLKLAGDTILSAQATGDGAGHVGFKTVGLLTEGAPNLLSIGNAQAKVDITSEHWSITEAGVLSIVSFGANWTNASRTVADMGIITTVDINGGTIDGTVIGGTTKAAGSFTNIAQLGTYTNGLDATVPVVAGFYASYSPLDKTAGGQNYQDRYVYATSLTGDGVVVPYAAVDAGTRIPGADGVNGFGFVLVAITGGAHAGKFWTIATRDDVFTADSNVQTWLNQHTEVGTGNYAFPFDGLYLTAAVTANGATSDYSWNIPGPTNYYGGPNPGTNPGFLEYRSGFTGGTASGAFKIYADTVGTLAYEFDSAGAGGPVNVFGSQGLFYDDVPLYFGGGVTGSPMGKIMYSPSAEFGMPAFGITFEKSDDDADGAALIIGSQEGGNDNAGTGGNPAGLVALYANGGSDAKSGSNANGGAGGTLYLWPGVGGAKDGAGTVGATGNVIACWDMGATPSAVVRGNFLIGTDSATGLRTTIEGSAKVAGDLLTLGRILGTQGVDVASASTITLGQGNAFELTGVTAVTLITNTGWSEGSVVTLIANENVTITHGTATSGVAITIKLAGSADYAMTANDTLTLMLCSTTAGAQAWREIARTAI
jgi:hypothetical protein